MVAFSIVHLKLRIHKITLHMRVIQNSPASRQQTVKKIMNRVLLLVLHVFCIYSVMYNTAISTRNMIIAVRHVIWFLSPAM